MRRLGAIASIAACLTVTTATARADGADDQGIQIHAFASEGGLLTTANNYLAFVDHGSLEFAEAGINFRKQLDDKLSAGVQLFGRDLGGTDLSAQLDWFGLDYHWRDWLGLRVGRVKIPFGLYNTALDIDAAQPVVLMPQSVYPIENRNFLLAQTGVDLYGFYRLGDRGGAIAYEGYLGALAIPLQSSPAAVINDTHVPFVAGARLLYETPLDGLRVAASVLGGKIDGDFTPLLPMPGPEMAFSITGTQLLGSVEYLRDDLQLAAEYGRSYTTTDAGVQMHTTSEQMYALAGYRWNPWLETTAYYSLLFPNVDDRSGAANHQHDAAICARFDITPHWLVKVEAHFEKGTAALSPALNGNLPLNMLTDQWGLFAAKTTVYF
jgi:hypothetical protein